MCYLPSERIFGFYEGFNQVDCIFCHCIGHQTWVMFLFADPRIHNFPYDKISAKTPLQLKITAQILFYANSCRHHAHTFAHLPSEQTKDEPCANTLSQTSKLVQERATRVSRGRQEMGSTPAGTQVYTKRGPLIKTIFWSTTNALRFGYPSFPFFAIPPSLPGLTFSTYNRYNR